MTSTNWILLAHLILDGPFTLEGGYKNRAFSRYQFVDSRHQADPTQPKSQRFDKMMSLFSAHRIRTQIEERTLHAEILYLRGGRPVRAKRSRPSKGTDTADQEGSNDDEALEQAALAMADPFSPKVAGGLSAWGSSRQRPKRKAIDEEEEAPQEEGAGEPAPALCARSFQRVEMAAAPICASAHRCRGAGARAGCAERLSDLDDDELDEYIQKGVKGDKDDIKIEALGGGGEDDDDEARPCPPPLPPTHPVAGPFARGGRHPRRRPPPTPGYRAAGGGGGAV